MFKSADGKQFGSRFVAKRRDDEQAKDKAKAAFEPEPETNEPATEPEGEEQQPEQENPEGVAEEHGPAHAIHIDHDHANNKHHVTSHHKDGHMHKSTHASPKQAHDAASKLAGATVEPKEEAAPAAAQTDTAAGGSLPQMA